MHSLELNLHYKYVCCNVAYYSSVVFKLLDTVTRQQQFSKKPKKLKIEKLCLTLSFKTKIKYKN